jgi:ribosomal protein S18 acetylase RimI-like enzyme
MDDLVVREINLEHLSSVADIHIAAFPDSTFTKLGFETVKRYYAWQFEGPHDLIALGAFQGDRLVGYLIGGKFRGALIGFLRKNWLFLFSRIVFAPWLLFSEELRKPIVKGGLYLLRSKIKGTPQSPEKREDHNRKFAGVLAIAVSPVFQRRGVGSRLLLDFESSALQDGYLELGLIVHIENKDALEFYRNSGWVTVGEQSGNFRLKKTIAVE